MLCCDEMTRFAADENVAVVYRPKFREHGILYLDGGTSKQSIYYCPWCGKKLPDSLRNAWFDRLEELGIDPDEDSIPEEFQSDAWWINCLPRGS